MFEKPTSGGVANLSWGGGGGGGVGGGGGGGVGGGGGGGGGGLSVRRGLNVLM